MHSNFFGDNKDHGKGFVLDSLFMAIPDWNLKVDPMLSDGKWGPGDQDKVAAYRRFLRLLATCEMINSDIQYRGLGKVTRDGKTESYFQPHLAGDHDLFFDPNTGVGAGGSSYLPRSVLPTLLPEKSSRVIIFFQSRSRKKGETQKVFERDFPKSLAGRDYRVVMCCPGQDTYVVFLSRKQNPRMEAFRDALVKAFHPFHEKRVRP